jgi:hypothetical protein
MLDFRFAPSYHDFFSQINDDEHSFVLYTGDEEQRSRLLFDGPRNFGKVKKHQETCLTTRSSPKEKPWKILEGLMVYPGIRWCLYNFLKVGVFRWQGRRGAFVGPVQNLETFQFFFFFRAFFFCTVNIREQFGLSPTQIGILTAKAYCKRKRFGSLSPPR